MLINKNWKIQCFDVGQAKDLEIADPNYMDHFWISAKVPGDVHSILLEKNLLDDPFFGHNDWKAKWVEEKVWWYRTEFMFEKDSLEEDERLELVFEGLDTFATIYLNGVELGSTENMFISHTFDVTREIVNGRNVIAVKFNPVSYQLKDKEKNYWAGFDKNRIWARKAQYHFGWDWGPQILTVGIWKEVRLEKRKIAKIKSVYARTLDIQDSRALVQIDIYTKNFVRGKQLRAEITLKNQEQQFSQTVNIDKDRATITLNIDNPKLWWTHDLGEPNLYQLAVVLKWEDEVLDIYETEIGIRTIEVMQRDREGNRRFTFVLNGVEMFAKGANWIPVDSFLGSVPESRYRHLVQLAKEANMNMLRVWGGGIYEKDVFYQECNRQGILVWQDFMFACALYPDYNRNYMENVRQEVVSVIKRLRNHPSVALWCGNNENDWLYEVERAAGNIRTPFYGEKIYHELIPELLEELDPSRFYWPSSPYGGNDHNSAEEGDRHNWQVWHGNIEPRRFGQNLGQNISVEGVSFRNYKKDHTRFCSEFGMHASANRYTLEKNMPEGAFYWGSDELAYRNKDYHHIKGILLMEGYTGIPNNIEEYMNYSMLTQAEGLKYGMEHYRRNKPQTSGALIWQLNDCWPGTSWSMIDYYLLPKASYYYSKKFNAPLLYTLEHDPGDDLHLWVVNDRLEEVRDTLVFEVFRFNGEIVYSKEFLIHVKGNASLPIASLSEAEVLQGELAEQVVVRLRSLNKKAEENYYYLRNHKDLQLPKAKLQVNVMPEKQEVEILTDCFARFVKLELPAEKIVFSDNFFDLLPSERKMIKIRHLDGQAVSLDGLSVSAINSSA
ncbi:glycoside hydrolase family 2 protein [Parageobacillus thermoglucosidasius]|uniref:beta-mannosidase n=1 Tax=Parageobacillus thermoglucosidasius TaxID=1426 RepID=UPI000E18A123|nr:glycoside hydrolase family 2 protein [Parageobacillus thermoglucosidasius]RDE35652.1 glycoside hydrolase family 2 protein [Parageobacillus thermoglucosidasius]